MEMYDGIKFCVKRGDEEVTDFICSLSLYLLDIFIDDITDYIKLLHNI
jgi:hypothetical protein